MSPNLPVYSAKFVDLNNLIFEDEVTYGFQPSLVGYGAV
jgi:hypothetical protein